MPPLALLPDEGPATGGTMSDSGAESFVEGGGQMECPFTFFALSFFSPLVTTTLLDLTVAFAGGTGGGVGPAASAGATDHDLRVAAAAWNVSLTGSSFMGRVALVFFREVEVARGAFGSDVSSVVTFLIDFFLLVVELEVSVGCGTSCFAKVFVVARVLTGSEGFSEASSFCWSTMGTVLLVLQRTRGLARQYHYPCFHLSASTHFCAAAWAIFL
ncbi:hypothetical protein CPB85DRAFT_705130 [Mucidula mucida]|nr:hypothetical protein CPB85DRAFT_705130 [Mucidula mucida]